MRTTITKTDHRTIVKAREVLEKETLATRISSLVGRGTDIAAKCLPDTVQHKIANSLNLTLGKATDWAWMTTGTRANPILRDNWIHTAAVTCTGLIGGAGGLATALWEIPISTTWMLRNIGCIAEVEGLDMSQEKTRLGCISVLAMGGDPANVRNEEIGYWVTRQTMAGLVSDAIGWSGKGTTPALVRFVTNIASRFGVRVSEKIAVQLVPFIGAGTGALINNIFLNHYKGVAHAHFSIERLCLKYGDRSVKKVYAAA